MKQPASHYRPSLDTSQSSQTGRFLFSLVIGILVISGTGAVLARFAIVGLIPPEVLIKVISSPASPEEEVAEASELPLVARLVPRPAAPQPSYRAIAMPAAPHLETSLPVETTDLLNQSEDALLAIERFQEHEAKRLEELQRIEEAEKKAAAEAALVAQKKAAEEAAERERQKKVARQLAAKREEEAQKKAASAQANRIVSTPTVSKRTTPNYPTSARRSDKQGTTQIAVTITSSGRVSSPRIIASSGHSSLDSSALAAVKKWRFNPAKNGLGQPVAFQMTIPITFRLR